MSYLGIFDQKCLLWIFLGQDFLKNYCHVLNQHPQIWIFAKFHEKLKCLNLGPKMFDLCIFGLESENNFAIFEVPSNLSIWKISSKNKNA